MTLDGVEIKIINPFTDIVPPEYSQSANDKNDYDRFSMGGGGENGLKADEQGLWFGSRKFADAPFKVDMSGNVTAVSLTITGGTIKYGKTSFSDSANAGYYIGVDGIYFGAAADATKFKYNIATGALDYVGNVSGRSSAALALGINASGQATDIVNGAITTVKMALAAVTADIVAANAITENKLYTGAVTADKIASNAITSAKINAGAVVAGKIAAGAVTATEINVSSLSAISANIGTVTAGTITGVLMQTDSGSYSGVKMSSSLNGIVIYGQTLEIRDTSNTLYGYIGGYSGYYNIATYNNRNILIGAGSGTIHFNSTAAPLNHASVNLGYYNYAFGNVYSLNYSFNATQYLNTSGSYIQSNSDFRVAGSIALTGNMTFENYASLTIKDSGGTSRTLTCQYNSTLGKYILST